MKKDKTLLKYLLDNHDFAANQNAIIADFMGKEIRDFSGFGRGIIAFKNVIPDEKKIAEYEKTHGVLSALQLPKEELITNYGITEWLNFEEHMRYNLNWGLLMPVVDKIESLENSRYGFCIDVFGVQITDYKEEELVIVNIERQEETKIQMVHQAVVEFVAKELEKQLSEEVSELK